jgi:hypothetical protein
MITKHHSPDISPLNTLILEKHSVHGAAGALGRGTPAWSDFLASRPVREHVPGECRCSPVTVSEGALSIGTAAREKVAFSSEDTD